MFYSRYLDLTLSLRENVQIRSIFWSVFPRIQTEYGEIRRIWTLFTQRFFQINSADAEMWKNISRKYLFTRTSRVKILSLKIGQWMTWILCYDYIMLRNIYLLPLFAYHMFFLISSVVVTNRKITWLGNRRLDIKNYMKGNHVKLNY